jgi:hypothetical protein
VRVLEFDGVGGQRDALYRVPYECCVVGHCWGDVGRLLEVGALVSGCCNDPTGGGGLWGLGGDTTCGRISDKLPP